MESFLATQEVISPIDQS